MKTTLFGHHDPVRRDRLDSNTIAQLDDVTGFAEVLDALDAARARHPGDRIVCTLDDPYQCAYTSMHATLALRDDDWDEEPDDDDPAAVHRYDNASTGRIAALLDDPDRQIEWSTLHGTSTVSSYDLDALAAMNRTPDVVLDDVVLIQRVPVARDDLAIAGIPNGYFTADRDIFANHAVVRRMADHGYRFTGLGATLLGFDRPTPPTPKQVTALIADLTDLYGCPEATCWAELAESLPTQRLLLLGYAEDFGDALDRVPPGTGSTEG
ncbi:hypothetical protein [Nocardia caishijiensis]|uniref:Uncharacterized protein n=1 Tax=Nocardia caishijiensis TaxID=184756 RepID=A0ABQ6YP04_9NOCA|nr:hypothetical protein [Nocardia caishijiensis]KAF0847537.1 hypothetical protein FNL39_103435 [Nocardia caishijiensis]